MTGGKRSPLARRITAERSTIRREQARMPWAPNVARYRGAEISSAYADPEHGRS